MTELQGSEGRIVRRGPYPEFTWTALLLGYGIGILITISLGYAALILGFSHEGSELAAILGYGVLRGLLGRTSIIENNINQTIATSVNGASAGMMFTIPALFILNETDFNPLLMVFACIAGSVLGTAFIIPLRKQMIDFERLTFPGGVAVATVLRSPGAGVHKAILLLIGIGLSATVNLISHIARFENLPLGQYLGMPAYLNGFWFISLLTVGVAFIAGRGGFAFIIGGFVCYWILGPILAAMGLLPVARSVPESLRRASRNSCASSSFGRWGSACSSAVRSRASSLRCPWSSTPSGACRTPPGPRRACREMRCRSGSCTSALPPRCSCCRSWRSTRFEGMGIVRGVIMALVGTLWIWMAGVILSECIGRTNWSPMSGMTLIGVTILVLIVRDLGSKGAIISSVMVGAAMCCSMAQATDLMHGSEGRLPGRGDPAPAADRPISRHLAGPRHRHGPDLRAAPGLRPGQRAPARAAGPGAGQRDQRASCTAMPPS